MIIGKSLTALGSGGLKPEITVTAKAGALLNLHYKDSSIILQSYQLGAEETQHTFVVDVSETAYVVDDVTNSASVEVLVDAVAQYSVEICYGLYLYKDGTNFANFERLAVSSVGTTSVTFKPDYIEMYSTYPYSGDGSAVAITTASAIDISEYSSINFDVDITGNGWLTQFAVSPTKSIDGNVAYSQLEGATFTRQVVSLDISNITGSYYPVVCQNSGQNSNRYTNVYRVWLE